VRRLAVILLLLIAPLAYSGGVRYVTTTGSGDSSGTSKAKAWDLLTANDSLGTGGIDTIKIYSGTYALDLYQANSGTGSAQLVYMAATDTSYPTIAGNNGGSDYSLDAQIIGYITGANVRLQRLTFTSNDYEDSSYSASKEYWVHLVGDSIIVDRCRFTTGAAQPYMDYWVDHIDNRAIGIFGDYVTVMNSFIRGTSMGVVIDWGGSSSNNATLYRDTIQSTGSSNVVLTGENAGAGYSGILIEQCYLDTSWDEDNIQLNGDAADSSVQIVVRNTVMKNAGENAFDSKGGWRCFVEGNTVFGTLNDDDGDKTIVPDSTDAHASTGAAFCQGTPGKREWWMVYRFNTLYSNGDGIDVSGDAAIYHNTLVNNRRRWNTAATLTGAYNIDATSSYADSRQVWIWVVNNIMVGIRNSGGTNAAITGGAIRANPDLNTSSSFGTGTPCTVALNGNLYYEKSDSMASGTRFVGYTDYSGGEVNTIYQGLTAWRAYTTATILAGAEDSSKEGNPLFLSADIYQTSYSASNDFTPATGSPAVGAAVALCRVDSNNTGTKVDVMLDASLFRDDCGIGSPWGTGITVLGDSLMIGDDLVRVDSVDYTAGHLTVNRSITTAIGDRVYFWRNGSLSSNIGASSSVTDSTVVNWNILSTSKTMVGNTRVVMKNVQRVNTHLVLRNPSRYAVTWPQEIIWLGLTTPPPLTDTVGVFEFVRDSSRVYGFMKTNSTASSIAYFGAGADSANTLTSEKFPMGVQPFDVVVDSVRFIASYSTAPNFDPTISYGTSITATGTSLGDFSAITTSHVTSAVGEGTTIPKGNDVWVNWGDCTTKPRRWMAVIWGHR